MSSEKVTPRGGIPELFCYGYDGLPGELKMHLFSLGSDPDLTPSDSEAAPEGDKVIGVGVARLAAQLLEQLRHEKELFLNSKARAPKLSHETRSWLYLLFAYCGQSSIPVPPVLYELLFESLGLAEGKPAREIAKCADIPAVQKLPEFLEAAALDGKADLANAPLSVRSLAEQVGVDRKTIRIWRRMQSYQDRRRYVEFNDRSVVDVYSRRRASVGQVDQ